MLISKVKKVYNFELQKKFKDKYGIQEMDYRYRDFFEELCDNGLYIRECNDNKTKLRITFIPFLICILILYIIGLFKYLFIGTFSFGENNFVIRKMIAWDKYCRFNIIR